MAVGKNRSQMSMSCGRKLWMFLWGMLVLVPLDADARSSRELRSYLRDSLQTLALRCEDVLDAAYMAQEYVSENRRIPGWEGFPVRLYRYHTGKDVRYGKSKEGYVYMLNPDARKLAYWIVYAVWDATGTLRYEDIEKVRRFVRWQSGGQFPVKGVVYEDMYTKDLYEPYIFKDGVTVYMADERMKASDKTCSPEQLRFYLNMENRDLKDYTGRYARICSTTREMYYAAGGKKQVGKSEDGQRDKAWLAVVAELYQKAWKSRRNFLIYAWAKSNL